MTFYITGKPTFSNGRRSLSKNPTNCTILDSCVFDYLILTDEPFAKALRIHETFVSVNDSLCGKLVSSLESPITFDESFKVTSALFSIL